MLCDFHEHAVAMRRLSRDRYLRVVGPDGKRGEAIDTGVGPDSGCWVCPECDRTHPKLPLPE